MSYIKRVLEDSKTSMGYRSQALTAKGALSRERQHHLMRILALDATWTQSPYRSPIEVACR